MESERPPDTIPGLCPTCRSTNPGQGTHCAQCGEFLARFAPGSVLGGRYEILGWLGRGGMGAVYRARDVELDEVVAVKLLQSRDAAAQRSEQRLRSEIKLARRIVHPNVCRIFEFGREGETSFIVMEYVSGVDLRRVLGAVGPLPPARAFEVAIGIASALDAVHGAGIIHRDLKTANIMLADDGMVKLMDFGIAKSTEAEGPGLTRAGEIVGTPEYMSPEQARGQAMDARSDVYALGVVIYELFAGTVPLQGDTPMDTLMKQINVAPVLSGPGAPPLPEPLVPILRRALDKDSSMRFPSAHDVTDALRAAQEISSGGKPGPSDLRRLADTVRKTLSGVMSPDRAIAFGALDEPTVDTGAAAPAATVAADSVPETVAGEAPAPARTVPPARRAAAAVPRGAPSVPRAGASPRAPAPSGLPPTAVWGLAALLVAVGIVWWKATSPKLPPTTPVAIPAPATTAPTAAQTPWLLLEGLASDAARTVEARTNAAQYTENENLVLDVDVQEAGYLNVLNVSESDTEISVLFPNGFVPGNPVQAGQHLTIPPQGGRFAFPASLAQGLDRERSRIVFIHTRAPLSAHEMGTGNGELRVLDDDGWRRFRAALRQDPGGYGAALIDVTITR